MTLNDDQRDQVLITLARMEGVFNTNISLLQQQGTTHGETLKDHEARLRTVEDTTARKSDVDAMRAEFHQALDALQKVVSGLSQWRWKQVGAITGLSASASIVVGLIEYLINK